MSWQEDGMKKTLCSKEVVYRNSCIMIYHIFLYKYYVYIYICISMFDVFTFSCTFQNFFMPMLAAKAVPTKLKIIPLE